MMATEAQAGGVSGEGLPVPAEDAGGEEGEKSCGGNRWPREEALALLKIRSDMDSVFRDSTHKAPLWDEVSRKLGELGYNRSAKKCKEKFENVYKYHKRTREVRTGKSDQNTKKNYRFFEELEALQNHQISFQSPKLPNPPWTTLPPKLPTVPLPTTNPTKSPQIKPNKNPFSTSPNTSPSAVFSGSTSSSTASDDDPRRRRKRKWSDFFVRLTNEVIQKQEGLQLKFLEALERIENQRKLRDEAWRMKEITMASKEHEALAQERSIAAAKDAAVVAFLEKLTPKPDSSGATDTQPEKTDVVALESKQNGVMTSLGSSSRWPKTEVEELIRVRTELEMKYQDNGPKGALWEEISAAMKKLGYSRSAKRCKEKWENINKYFKKVKESNKKRPEDSKTCPYFNQLDALYKEKERNSFDINNQMEPLMVEPEQQWPPPPFQVMGNNHGEVNDPEGEEEEDDDDDEDGGNSSVDEEDEQTKVCNNI